MGGIRVATKDGGNRRVRRGNPGSDAGFSEVMFSFPRQVRSAAATSATVAATSPEATPCPAVPDAEDRRTVSGGRRQVVIVNVSFESF